MDEMVEDWIYTEVVVQQKAEELVHTNGVVAGEIRADCEVCYDSERLQTKEVGRYSAGKLPNIRVCSNCVLRGPAPTRVGMSVELLLFHPDASDDMHIRVLLAFKPVDFQDIQGFGKVPSALGLGDVLIVRERRERRPLKLDENPDELWRPVDEFAKARPVFSTSYQFRKAPETVLREEGAFPQAALQLPAPSALGSGEESADLYTRTFPGAILVEAGEIIYAGMESRVRVTWEPCATNRETGMGSGGRGVVYCAEIAFKALETVTASDIGLRVSPPELLSFTVKEK